MGQGISYFQGCWDILSENQLSVECRYHHFNVSHDWDVDITVLTEFDKNALLFKAFFFSLQRFVMLNFNDRWEWLIAL
jgi:hypothetical protein